MSTHSQEDREKWAEYFQSSWRLEFRPAGMTKRKTAKALKKVWDNDYFWFNTAVRFGLRTNDPRSIDIHSLEQATSNFWAMLREAATTSSQRSNTQL
jgi:hypothetical protein